jgi:hypothetical protein
VTARFSHRSKPRIFFAAIRCNQTEHSIQEPTCDWTLSNHLITLPHIEDLVLTGRAGAHNNGDEHAVSVESTLRNSRTCAIHARQKQIGVREVCIDCSRLGMSRQGKVDAGFEVHALQNAAQNQRPKAA